MSQAKQRQQPAAPAAATGSTATYPAQARRSDPQLSQCTCKAERLACLGLRPTGYRDSVEHRRCDACGFGAWIPVTSQRRVEACHG